jgi:hypothetical protein
MIGIDPQGRPLVINNGGLIDYAPYDETTLSDQDVIRRMLSSKTAKPKDCDVCYGTGRFKGFGGPCSEGCPTKGGA